MFMDRNRKDDQTGDLEREDSPAPTPSEATPVLDDPVRRQTIEFLIILGIGILLLRTFAAEAYVVPTGSMAPTLLGFHRELTCPNCKFPFVVGSDEQGRSGRPVCPNCGQDGLGKVASVECNGDRLLVQKYFFDFRRPNRWEVAVFHSPAEPDQAYVKRVVGLPGEAIQIVDGDLFANGRLVRKSLREQHATRILVYENDFVPLDADRYPRFGVRGDRSRHPVPSGWRSLGSRFVHDKTPTSDTRQDWVDYRHWDPDRGRYGPVRDFCPYNGGDVRGDNVVHDLMLEAEVSVQPDVQSISLRLDHGADHFVVTLPVDGPDGPTVRRDDQVIAVAPHGKTLRSSPPESPTFSRVEASVIDRRLIVAIDGELAFEPFDFEPPLTVRFGPPDRPLGVGILGGSAEIRKLRVFRDIYYTGQLVAGPRRPFGVDRPYLLGDDEYFVLGDNSPVSNDSRFWEGSPVVRGDRFLGKPFLVHLPGQVFALRVFGRPLGWIPDPREIRYIR
jgi:signal peptidase I